MSYYHVRLLRKEDSSYYYAPNLTEQNIRKFAEQYVKGKKVYFKGEWIKKNDIKEISIRMTDRHSIQYADSFTSGAKDIFDFGRGKVVTIDVMSLPSTSKEIKKPSVRSFSKNVFIVHGRDHKPMKELKAMLTEFGLNPIVLHEQPSGSRTIVEQLEKYSDVGYAFVILTPDDAGSFFSQFSKAIEGYVGLFHNIRGDFDSQAQKARQKLYFKFKEIDRMMNKRARQNVVLEFGYFIGLLGRDRVCCLYKGNIELPSDMHGIVYISFKESVNEVRNKIIKELKEAGYEIEA